MDKLKQYALLIRLNKPIGIYLLLWPTLWALWIASHGHPPLMISLVFVIGVFLMRSAGCAINDFADRDFDPHVTRTKTRPIASKKIKAYEALIIFISFSLIAFLLVVFFLNRYALYLSFFGVMITFIYPFVKRYSHLPQIVLGAAFSWGIPMAFASINNHIDFAAWLIFITAVIWPVIYDTFYAMSDREDDLSIGVKSSAIFFGQHDRLITALLQVCFFCLLLIVSLIYHFNFYFYLCFSVAIIFSIYQQYLIKHRERQLCFQAFLNNNWVGLFIFIGIVLNYL